MSSVFQGTGKKVQRRREAGSNPRVADVLVKPELCRYAGGAERFRELAAEAELERWGPAAEGRAQLNDARYALATEAVRRLAAEEGEEVLPRILAATREGFDLAKPVDGEREAAFFAAMEKVAGANWRERVFSAGAEE